MTRENDGAERDAADLMPRRLTRRNHGARQEIEGQKAGQSGRRRHVRDHECRRVGRRHTAVARPEQPNSQTGSRLLASATGDGAHCKSVTLLHFVNHVALDN
jgi:hypothetical protein